MLLHFALVLHFAAIFITFCVNITFWGDYYILRRNKYWFSLTSVKALIFLLRLNPPNKIFFAFLGFHKWWHVHPPFTLPCLRPYTCLPPVPNLWLLLLLFQIAWVFGFIMATRGATMMIVEIDSPTFPVITFITRGKSRKMKVSQSPLEESRKRPGLGERDSSKFSALHEKIPHTGNTQLHCL